MQTVTAKDIAERIQRRGEPLQAAVDRLRNWTKEGIIKPSGEKHPGTGRARRYSERATFEAVLLQAIIDGTSMPAVDAAIIVKDVMGHPETEQAWATKYRGDVFVLGRSFDFRDAYFKAGPKKRLIKEMMDVGGPKAIHLIINLELIFQRAFPEKD